MAVPPDRLADHVTDDVTVAQLVAHAAISLTPAEAYTAPADLVADAVRPAAVTVHRVGLHGIKVRLGVEPGLAVEICTTPDGTVVEQSHRLLTAGLERINAQPITWRQLRAPTTSPPRAAADRGIGDDGAPGRRPKAPRQASGADPDRPPALERAGLRALTTS